MGSKLYDKAVADAAAHHANSKTYSGKFLRPHKPYLSAMIADLEIRSALDYGCGKGEQYNWVDPEDGKTLEQAWGFEVAKFDPCWPPFAAEPVGNFDLVICTHVLGSIPIKDLSWVVERMLTLATKAVYIAEKIGPIKKAVHGDREGFPNEWSAARWQETLESLIKASGISAPPMVILSTLERTDQGKIMKRTVLRQR